jgi:hypothetical protein
MPCHVFLFREKIVAGKKHLQLLLALVFAGTILNAQPAPMDQHARDSFAQCSK